MRKMFFASVAFAGGASFGLALAAVVALGLISQGSPAPSPVSSGTRVPDVSVTVSERYLNSLIESQIKAIPGFRNVHIKLEP